MALCCMLGGCAAAQQSEKGGPLRLTSAEQAQVNSAISSTRRVAVVIGINEFDDSKWPSLSYAVKDAEDVASVLNDERYGRFDKVIALTGPHATTKSRILATLDDLARQNLSKDDTVIFYISSHGTIDRAADGKLHQYVVARDSRFGDIPGTAIDLNDIRTAFNGLLSNKKALILAFCHSGRGKSQLNDAINSELRTIKTAFFVKPIETASEAAVVLTASAWGETAREDRSFRNDIYTHFLIEGIKKNDRNNDGAVSITEAHDYAREQTYYYTKGEQRPSMESMILGADPIILAGAVQRRGKPVLYDYSRRYEGLTMFVDGEKKGTLPLGVAMDPGLHMVELRTGDNARPLYEEAFKVSEGEDLALPILLDGYDQGTSLRLAYQGFLSGEVDRSVAKPMMTYGIAYSNHAYFSPHLGYRADLSYGQATQHLTTGSIDTSAEVTQVAYGLTLLYREAMGGVAIYGGPRVGGLNLTRQLAVGGLGKQSDTAASMGAMVGMNFRYKKRVAFMLEGALNAANVRVGGSGDSFSYFYSVVGGLSVNF